MKRFLSTVVLILLVMGYMEKVLASDSKISSEDAKSIIRKRAEETIQVLKNKDFKHLSRLVHPDKGLKLSQYSFAKKDDVVLNRHEIQKFSTSKKKFISVLLGESENSKDLTFGDYYDRYIYDHDYSSASEINFNNIVGRGSEGNNLFGFFPEAIIVEYYFSGFDPKREGTDWESLYLVFERADDSKWYLVDVAHAEKTE
ncbi:MAG TPA: hypothetical protein VIJ93_10660 [bacterium]